MKTSFTVLGEFNSTNQFEVFSPIFFTVDQFHAPGLTQQRFRIRSLFHFLPFFVHTNAMLSVIPKMKLTGPVKQLHPNEVRLVHLRGHVKPVFSSLTQARASVYAAQ